MIVANESNDKHCVTMTFECAQILSTTYKECDGVELADKLFLYKKAHLNHPVQFKQLEKKRNF